MTHRRSGQHCRKNPGQHFWNSHTRYSTGADWAKEREWTVIATLRYDVRPARLVAYERIARLPWPVMVECDDRHVRCFPDLAHFDATGIGNVVRDLLSVPARARLSGRFA